MDNNFEEKLKILRQGYINKLKENFANFKDLAKATPINFEEVYTKVHTISGTSGMYGLNDLSKASTEFEFYLKPFKENPDIINQDELKSKLTNYLDYIEKIIEAGE